MRNSCREEGNDEKARSVSSFLWESQVKEERFIILMCTNIYNVHVGRNMTIRGPQSSLPYGMFLQIVQGPNLPSSCTIMFVCKQIKRFNLLVDGNWFIQIFVCVCAKVYGTVRFTALFAFC